MKPPRGNRFRDAAGDRPDPLAHRFARRCPGGYQKPEPITVRVQAVKASRGRVRIYATAGLANYPFREDNLRAMRDSVRALLPHEFRKASIELYTDNREASELIPLALPQRRAGAQTRRQKEDRPFHQPLRASARDAPFGSETPARGPFGPPISPCGRATGAISTRRRTAGNGSVRRSGRPARTSIRKATFCPTWFRCSKTPGRACCCRANATCRSTKCWPITTMPGSMRRRGRGRAAARASRTSGRFTLRAKIPSATARRAVRAP